jgi:hypothetical protein
MAEQGIDDRSVDDTAAHCPRPEIGQYGVGSSPIIQRFDPPKKFGFLLGPSSKHRFFSGFTHIAPTHLGRFRARIRFLKYEQSLLRTEASPRRRGFYFRVRSWAPIGLIFVHFPHTPLLSVLP